MLFLFFQARWNSVSYFFRMMVLFSFSANSLKNQLGTAFNSLIISGQLSDPDNQTETTIVLFQLPKEGFHFCLEVLNIRSRLPAVSVLSQSIETCKCLRSTVVHACTPLTYSEEKEREIARSLHQSFSDHNGRMIGQGSLHTCNLLDVSKGASNKACRMGGCRFDSRGQTTAQGLE